MFPQGATAPWGPSSNCILRGDAFGRPLFLKGVLPVFRILSVYGGLLLRAMGQTLLLALCGLFFACILGLIFGLLSVLKNRVCNIISTITYCKTSF